MVAKVLTAIVTEHASAPDLIWAQRRQHLQAIAQLRDKKTDPDLSLATRLVLEGAILRAEADLRWLDLCEERLQTQEGEEL
jgi:hypothetical protein